ncbi:16204_t:CDS:2 [Entrophospora sp. SA101]|nr:16204_t:CDS:2 [Entrophospora sp. SA101]
MTGFFDGGKLYVKKISILDLRYQRRGWANNGDLISREYAGTSALKGDYTGRGKSYKEKVIILTKKALYVCTFHYRLEKVMQFQRIGLGEITYEYILSTLYPSCASPEDNYDFVVYYQASGETSSLNTGSMLI